MDRDSIIVLTISTGYFALGVVAGYVIWGYL